MNENEFFKAIISQFNKMHDYDIKTAHASEKNFKEIQNLIDLVNVKLKFHGVNETITKDHIQFYADFIGNILAPVSDKKLSYLIFDKYFPQPKVKSYYHFTSFDAANNIILSQSLRLSNLIKRFSDGEYSKFYSDHGMDGYKIGGSVLGIDYSETSIMSEIFFHSLTTSSFDQFGETKWQHFGDNGKGIRIEYEVIAKHNDFRKVYYQNNIPLLKDLFEEIKNEYSMPFNFTYSSKIGAFYIKGAFKNEDEYRFLIKRTSDDYNASYLKPTITNLATKEAYIEIPLVSNFADFKVISIQPGYNCSDANINTLKNTIALKDPSIKILCRALEDYNI